MDMDRVTKGRSTMSKVGTHFVEDTQRSRCSKCHKPGHNRRKCLKLLREQVPNAFVCLVVTRFLINVLLSFVALVCHGYILLYLFFLVVTNAVFTSCYSVVI